MPEAKPSWLVRAVDLEQHEFRHPWEPRSLMRGMMLSRRTGMKRTGVNYVRIPAGHAGSAYHEHKLEEEWMYVLEGRGRAEVNGESVDVGPGDFLGFPAPGFAHAVESLGPGDLVFLAGGESRGEEIADFPRLGKRAVRVGEQATVHVIEGESFFGMKKL